MKKLLSALSWLLFIGISPFSVAQNTINLKAETEHAYLLKGIPNQKSYLYLELEGAKNPSKESRPPLNLAVVIDRSGSMEAENKLEYVKKACDVIIDHLGPDDLISIVAYDTEVDVIKATGKIENKAILKSKIQKLKPGSSTNLSGGMLEGYAQAKKSYNEHFVNRVLLLSDGLANHGITELSKLQDIVAAKYQEDKIALSTFGVGIDYNEDLMTNLSEYGHGNYYFIEEPDKIPSIFNTELKGLLSVVAQNSKLTFSIKGTSTTITKVLGFHHSQEGNQYIVDFHDIFSQEQKAILVELDHSTPPTEKLTIQVTTTYDDVLANYKRVTVKKELTIDLTTNTNTYNESLNEMVTNNKILFLSNELFEQATRAVDKNDYEEAKKLLKKNQDFFEEETKDIKLEKEVEHQIKMNNEYLEKLDEIKNYSVQDKKRAQKQSKNANYELRKKKH